MSIREEPVNTGGHAHTRTLVTKIWRDAGKTRTSYIIQLQMGTMTGLWLVLFTQRYALERALGADKGTLARLQRGSSAAFRLTFMGNASTRLKSTMCGLSYSTHDLQLR